MYRTTSYRPREEDLPIIMIGAGGHAKVLIDTLKQLGRHILFATDDSSRFAGSKINGVPVRGPQESVLEFSPDEVELVNGIGSVNQPLVRQQVYLRFTYRAYRFASVVHPAACIVDSVQVAPGLQAMIGAVVQSHAILGANVLLNTRCSVDHDAVIGSHTHIAPGAVLCGNVSVGQTSHIGSGATIVQGVRLGHQSMVAAGAVVVCDVPPRVMVRGVPAKPH